VITPSGNLSAAIAEGESTAPRVSRWRWWVHLILIGGYFIPIPFLRHFRHQPALTSSVRGLLLVCGADLAFFALIFGLGWYASRATREELLLRWRPGPWVVPLGFVYSLGIRLAAGAVVIVAAMVLVGTQVLSPEQLQDFLKVNRPDVQVLVDVPAMQDNPAYFWLTVTLVSFILAGLREELWRCATLAALRALWPGAFASMNGQFVAVTLIAVVFGAGHLAMGWLAATMAGLLGLFLGLIMVLHKSIWPAVFAHGFLDATSFALLPWIWRNFHHLQ
jgi:membrane protease YdiL (CAAX protease family)